MTENNERTIALCGVWHVHAESYCREAMKHCRILGVWEEDAERRADFCTRTGLPAFESFEDLLASGADGAIVCCATRDHAAVIPRLAAAGMDVFTEKVLAITDQDAEKIRSAVLKCGNRFMISLPHKCSGTVRAAYTAALSGRLGKLNYFRFRNVHSGSSRNWLPAHFYDRDECGGGAMIDLGAHGMYLADWFLGVPEEARSVFTRACANPETALKNTDGVEDNAITLLRYASGAIAVNETGFVNIGEQVLEVGGEEGRIRIDGSGATLYADGADGPETLPPEPNLPSPILQFCTGGILPGFGIDEAVRLTWLMTMAYADN